MNSIHMYMIFISEAVGLSTIYNNTFTEGESFRLLKIKVNIWYGKFCVWIEGHVKLNKNI